MRVMRAVAILLLAVLPASAQTAKPADPKVADVKAQDFRVEEVGSFAEIPLDQLKPRSIAFADKAPDNLLEPGTIFMRYEAWAKARPLEAQSLGLYPGYTEPNTDIVVDGT